RRSPRMRKIALASCTLWVFIVYAALGLAQNVNERYPFRLPDWLWDTPNTAHLLSTEDVLTLRGDIEKLAKLEKLQSSIAAESLENDIAKRLSNKFTIRDLAVGAFVAKNKHSDAALAVQIDPSFDEIAKAMIQSAVSRFVEVALDPDLIKRAFERSTLEPSPMPERFEVENGKRKVDEIGRPVLNSDYRLYLRLRVRPINAELFSAELRNALAHPSGEPTVLVVSRYKGDWWGGAYHNYYSNPIQRLGREGPTRGYFYIRLNSDRFAQVEAGWNDPNFWASKIAHELLHNLGYWHPNYKDLKEKADNNRGESWSFLVSYEDAILERLTNGKN